MDRLMHNTNREANTTSRCDQIVRNTIVLPFSPSEQGVVAGLCTVLLLWMTFLIRPHLRHASHKHTFIRQKSSYAYTHMYDDIYHETLPRQNFETKRAFSQRTGRKRKRIGINHTRGGGGVCVNRCHTHHPQNPPRGKAHKKHGKG